MGKGISGSRLYGITGIAVVIYRYHESIDQVTFDQRLHNTPLYKQTVGMNTAAIHI